MSSPAGAPDNRRTRPRVTLRVIHRHRIGSRRLRRVSELAFVAGDPVAILEWIDVGGVRTPLVCRLEAKKLRRDRNQRLLFYYEGETVDPRFDDVGPD